MGHSAIRPAPLGGLDGAGGTPWELTCPQFYYPHGDNFAVLRSQILDDSDLE